MSCCGNKRTQWVNMQTQPTAKNEPALTAPGPEYFSFEYLGEHSYSIAGPITGNTYHFTHNGHVLEIDYRDTPFMMGVAVVRKKKINMA